MSGITGRTYLERGKPVVVITQWRGKGPRNVAIRREDGSVTVRPFRGLRRAPVNDSAPAGAVKNVSDFR